jgi:hypothetical protein
VQNTTHELYDSLLGRLWLSKLLVSHDDELETGRVYDRLYGRAWVLRMLDVSLLIKDHSNGGHV